MMRISSAPRAGRWLAPLFLALATQSPWVNALQEFSEAQSETALEIVKQLEQRHYAKLSYDDTLSSQHLDAYVDALDRGRMFLLAADVREFEKYRQILDDQWRGGDLSAGFDIFNRYETRLVSRLEDVVANIDTMVAGFDYQREEFFELDPEQRDWATTPEQLDELWRKQLKNQALSLKMADKPDGEIASTLKKRYENQLKRVRQYNNQDVFQLYANALTELYDPHTNYFSPRRSENFNIHMSLSLEGIGAVLQREDEYTKVARLVPAGPADKEGSLQPSDRIVAVGQGNDGDLENVIGWRLDEVVELVRGKKGSTVRLEVIPAKDPDVRKVINIVRNEVKLEEQSAQKKILEIPDGDSVRKVGVIDIPAFYIDFEAMRRGDDNYKSTTRDVSKLLDELVAENVDGIIIDLRNNGGGSLQEANELTGLFIEYGPTVQIRHSSRRVWRDGKRLRGDYYEGPLMVMINRLSASASEIFAGAIQDYQRGIVVGDPSFGKGTVQTLVPLTEGQLKLTESKFYRISGDSTQHRGVVPDIQFPSLYDDSEIGESALDHALPWDQINPVRHRRYHDLKPLLPELTNLSVKRAQNDPELVYLTDQVALLQESRGVTELPLNETARKSLRETQEAKALVIENKRRVARGEEPLASLDGDSDEAGTEDEAADAESGSADPSIAVVDTEDDDTEAEQDDVLLTEASRILVDALLMQDQQFAVNRP